MQNFPIRNILSTEASTTTTTAKEIFSSNDGRSQRAGICLHNCDDSSDIWLHLVKAGATAPVISEDLKVWAIPAKSTILLDIDTSIDIYIAASTGTINYVALEVG